MQHIKHISDTHMFSLVRIRFEVIQIKNDGLVRIVRNFAIMNIARGEKYFMSYVQPFGTVFSKKFPNVITSNCYSIGTKFGPA